MEMVVGKKAGSDDELATSDKFSQLDMEGPEYRAEKIPRTIVCSITRPTGPKSELPFCQKKLEIDREGNERDVDAIYLTELFEKQSKDGLMACEIWQDIGYEEFVRRLKTDKSLKDYDTFLFVFLTYLGDDEDGTCGMRIHFTDMEVSLTELQNTLKTTPPLYGKSKLLLVQADKHDLQVIRHTDMLPPEEEERYKTVKIPTDSDILVMMSTVPREQLNPVSLLIQAFGEMVAMNNGRARGDQEDFLTLTVSINARFQKLYNDISHGREKVPLPVVMSTLRKLLYL